VSKHIGTAPAHNENQNYLEAEPERPVYCEDQKKEMDLAECTQVGEFYYSVKFLDDFYQTIGEIVNEADILDNIVNKFFLGEGFDMKLVLQKIGSIQFELGCIREMFEKIDIAPEKKK